MYIRVSHGAHGHWCSSTCTHMYSHEMGHTRGNFSTPTFSFADTIVCNEAAAVVCAPCHLAREERKEESRPEGTDDGELEEEEEGGGGEDKLEDEELSPPDHIAGAPMERDRCLNMVSVCVWCVSVCVCTICVCTHVCGVCVDGDVLGGGSCKASKVVSAFPLVWLSSQLDCLHG